MKFRDILRKYIDRIQSILNKQTFNTNKMNSQNDIDYFFENVKIDDDMYEVGKDIKEINVETYKKISEDFKGITLQTLEMNCLKSTIYFNLFFYLEIKIKSILISYGVNLKTISKTWHCLDELIKLKSDFPIKIDELKNKLKIILHEDQKVNSMIRKHENLKYNSFKSNDDTNSDTLNLIFKENKINEEEKKGVKEIILWIESII